MPLPSTTTVPSDVWAVPRSAPDAPPACGLVVPCMEGLWVTAWSDEPDPDPYPSPEPDPFEHPTSTSAPSAETTETMSVRRMRVLLRNAGRVRAGLPVPCAVMRTTARTGCGFTCGAD